MMTIEEIIDYEIGFEDVYSLENALERICDIDENITVKKLLEIIRNH